MSSSLVQRNATVNQLPVSQQTVPLGAMSCQLPQRSAPINLLPVSYTPLQFPVQQFDGAMRAAFAAFESAIQTPVRVKYRRRVDEGYDLPGSPTYEVWKKLYTVSSTPIGDPPDVSSTPQHPKRISSITEISLNKVRHQSFQTLDVNLHVLQPKCLLCFRKF